MTAPTQTPVNQLSLFEAGRLKPITPVTSDQDLTIEERFEQFHEANPHVAEALARLALRLRRRGRKRFGMKALFEILRYQHALQTDDPNSSFKLNNDFSSRYARLLMDEYAELEDFFETRELKSA